MHDLVLVNGDIIYTVQSPHTQAAEVNGAYRSQKKQTFRGC